MDQTKTALNETMQSLLAAGRGEDAAAVARTLELYAEIGEWVACLRCGMAFPKAEALRVHYSRSH